MLNRSHTAESSPESFEQTKSGSSRDFAGIRGINTNAALGQLEKCEHLLVSPTTDLQITGMDSSPLQAQSILLPTLPEQQFHLQAGITFYWGGGFEQQHTWGITWLPKEVALGQKHLE